MGVFITILISAAAFGFWRLRFRPSSATKPAVRDSEATSAFASVALRCSRSACGAALRLRNRKILAADAPALPLPNCDRPSCDCCYRKLADRRGSEGRRMIDLGIRPLIFDGRELRRQPADRRVD